MMKQNYTSALMAFEILKLSTVSIPDIAS